MRKNMLTVLILLFSLVLITGLVAGEKQVLPISSLTEREFVADNSKPGGIVIGPAMPRAFHYGGRQVVRDLDGYLHATWEDPTYSFNYYARSLDTLGLTWTEPINPHATYGVVLEDGSILYELDRALMGKMATDPRTGYLYMMPFHRLYAGERYKTGITRSTDGGATWAPYLDLGGKINRPTEEVSWGTMTIGYDPNDANKTIFHIAYSKGNADIMYTRADLSVIDDAGANLSLLAFTQSDGTTPGDEAISYVPSGVVFQGTIVLDRNNDPHIIFSGDGGSDTFGDKTPYHIYYKSAVDAWGPIPPTAFQAELEACWGMPEMVFDKNNRGYYFLDNNPGDFTFGTWEPPTSASSATDFGTLNGSGAQAAADAVDMTVDNFANIEITDADNLYLPQADIDDANDMLYVVGNTNSYSSGNGGDIVLLSLDISTYTNTTTPAEMDWVLKRRITDDGIGLGDVGADMVYDPTSSTIDVFWSGAGATSNEAQYLPAHIPPPATDAQAVTIIIGIPGDKPEVNKNDVVLISGIIKNNGTSSIPPVPVVAKVLDENGVALFTGDYIAPPLAPGAITPEILFGSWTVANYGQTYSITLSVALTGDEASYNDFVGTSFFAYPDTLETYGWDNWDDTLSYTGIPVFDQDGVVFGGFANGWFVVDNSNGPFEDARDDYVSTWYFTSDDNNALDQYPYIRHMVGVRNDTIFGDISPPAGMDVADYAQPQDESLFSPFYSFGAEEGLVDSVQFRFQWKNPNNNGSYATWDIDDIYLVKSGNSIYLKYEDNVTVTLESGDTHYPINANIDLSIDGGLSWLTVLHREATLDGTVEDKTINDVDFEGLDITSLVTIGLGVDNDYTIPVDFALSQNYPNPFNPVTIINFSVPTKGHVRLDVYSLTGQQVATLLNGQLLPGNHKIVFNASDLSSGVYFYKLKTNDRTITKKMLFLK